MYPSSSERNSAAADAPRFDTGLYSPHAQLVRADTTLPPLAPMAAPYQGKPARTAQTLAARTVAWIWSWVLGATMFLGVGSIVGGLMLGASILGGSARKDLGNMLPILSVAGIVLGFLVPLAALGLDRFMPQSPKKNRS